MDLVSQIVVLREILRMGGSVRGTGMGCTGRSDCTERGERCTVTELMTALYPSKGAKPQA